MKFWWSRKNAASSKTSSPGNCITGRSTSARAWSANTTKHRNLLVTNLGELTPAMIARVIAARIARFFDSAAIHERLEFLEAKEAALAKQRKRAERKPWFCSGCPHNTSTVVPEGSIAFGGIGCHYMATWMDRGTETFTQMGGEGATWLGQAPFTERKHVFQNLGDGTYFHSGLLAIRAAVAAGVNITYKILYNDAVAMTGGQPLDGELSVAQIVAQLRAEGVQRIALVSDQPEIYRYGPRKFDGVSVAHRNQLEAIQLELRDTEGCTRAHLCADLCRGKTPAAQERHSRRPSQTGLHQRCRVRRLRRLRRAVQLPVDHSQANTDSGANALSTRAPATRIIPACAVSARASSRCTADSCANIKRIAQQRLGEPVEPQRIEVEARSTS